MQGLELLGEARSPQPHDGGGELRLTSPAFVGRPEADPWPSKRFVDLERGGEGAACDVSGFSRSRGYASVGQAIRIGNGLAPSEAALDAKARIA